MTSGFLGGFHQIVKADNLRAVNRLRELKGRTQKPFGLMYSDISQTKNDCQLTELETKLPESSEAPIMLLKRKVFRQKCIHQPAYRRLGIETCL